MSTTNLKDTITYEQFCEEWRTEIETVTPRLLRRVSVSPQR